MEEKKAKKVYITGNNTGERFYRDRSLFLSCFYTLQGCITLGPSTAPEGLSTQEYMSITLPKLLASDAVALLPDWKDSPRARIEKALAEYCGKEIIEL